ncbi:MAG: hydrogenase maturation factor [Eubacterium sp.]|nr:hydrogenase maturation factor [Eubacterium sp.]
MRQLNKEPDGDAGVGVVTNPVEGWTLAAPRAVYGAVNALVASGLLPAALALTLLMPPGTEEKQLKQFMKELGGLCAREGLAVTAGHTAVSSAVNTLLLSVTGMGTSCRKAESVSVKSPDKNLDVVMTGHAGREGAALLAIEREDQLQGRYAPSYIETAKHFYDHAGQSAAAGILWQCGAVRMHDIREGGVFGALWELSSAVGTGLDIELKDIPVRQHTIEICEFFDLNPYKLLSGGCLLALCPDGEEAVSRLMAGGIPAEIIGKTSGGNDRLIRYDTETRYLEPSGMDEIYKVISF